MYRHTAEAIKESSRRQFISQEQKDRFDNYPVTFIDKEESYSKDEVGDIIHQLKTIKCVEKGEVLSASNTVDSSVLDYEVYGNTEQYTELHEFIPETEPGAVGLENGNAFDFEERQRTGFIEVNPYDEIRFLNSENTKLLVPVNCVLYDNDKNYVSGSNVTKTIIPYNVKYIRFYNATYEPTVLVSRKSVELDKINSLGKDIADETYSVTLKSSNRNLFDLEAFYDTIKDINGVSRDGASIFLDCGVNTAIATEIYYKTYDVIYNKFKPNTRYYIRFERHDDSSFRPNLKFEYTDGTLDNAQYKPSGTNCSISDPNKDVGRVVIGWNTQLKGGRAELKNIIIGEYFEGCEDLNYIEHEFSNKTIHLPVQLEKVGDYSDRLFKREDGVWCIEKIVKTIVVNDNHLFTRRHNVDDDYAERYCMDVDDIIINNSTYTPLISSLFPYVYDRFDTSECNVTNIFIHNTRKRIDIKRMKNDLRFNSESELNRFMKGSIIKYPTENPEIIELPVEIQNDLKSFDEMTHVWLEDSGDVSSELQCEFSLSLGSSIQNIRDRETELRNKLDSIRKLEEGVSFIRNASESGIVEIDTSTNGVVDDITIEGRTIVNLSDTYNKLTHITDTPTPSGYSKSEGFFKIDFDIVWEDIAYIQDGAISIEAGKTYTYIATVKDNTVTRRVELFPYMWSKAVIISGDEYVTVGFEGRKVLTFKAIDDTYFRFGYRHNNQSGLGSYKVGEFIILEGDYSDKDISFFEGLKSVDSSIISSKSKINEQSSESRLVYIDNNGNYNDVILRSIPSGVRDTIEKHEDGKYYYHKRCTEITLNGTEEGWYLNGYNRFAEIGVYNVRHDEKDAKRENIICDKLLYGIDIIINNENPPVGVRTTAGCRGQYSTGIRIKPYAKSNGNQYWELDEITSWLTENPLHLVYGNNVEEVYECLPISLNTYKGGTIISTKSVVPSSHIRTSVRGNVRDVVSDLKDRVLAIENLIVDEIIFQNKLTLQSLYNADSSNLKVEISTATMLDYSAEDYELYSLIYKNIISGVTESEVSNLEEIIDFYTMIGKLTFDMANNLFETLNNNIV